MAQKVGDQDQGSTLRSEAAEASGTDGDAGAGAGAGVGAGWHCALRVGLV